jgi:hypothetical protein
VTPFTWQSSTATGIAQTTWDPVHTGRLTPPAGGGGLGGGPVEAPSSIVCSWPSSKAGAKPELLRHLELYIRKQLTALHHTSAAEKELQAILRLDMSRHCVREFQKHFKIYADIFCTVGDTLDGVTAVFDQHREHIDGLNADAEELRAAIRQLEAQLVAQQRKHDEEMNASVTLQARLAAADEDRKVLNALCDDLQRQLHKQRQFVDASQERLDSMSRQHVLQAMRDERQRVKLEGAEQAYEATQSKLIGLEKDRKTLQMRLEIADVEAARVLKEFKACQVDNSALNSVIHAKDEEIKMLRFDLKRRGHGGGGGPSALAAKGGVMSIDDLDQETKKALLPQLEAELRKTMTPRPHWYDMHVHDEGMFTDLTRPLEAELLPPPVAPLEVVDRAPAPLMGGGGSDGNAIPPPIDPAAPPSTQEPKMDKSDASLAATPRLAAFDVPTRSPRHRMSSPSASHSVSPGAQMLLPPTNRATGVPSADRVSTLVAAYNECFDRAAALQAKADDLTNRLVVQETLQGAFGGVNSMEQSTKLPAAEKKLDGSRGKSVVPKVASTGGGKKPALQIATETLFVPCGITPSVPVHLRAPDTNRTIALRPMTLAVLTKTVVDASRHVGLWLADMDPPRAHEKHQGLVGSVEQGPTFAAGFTQWLVAEYRLRRRLAGAQEGTSAAGGEGGAAGGAPAHAEAIAPAGEFAGDFSLELSYSLVYHARAWAYERNHALLRMFILTLGGDLPRDTMSKFESRLRAIRRAFESVDPQGTGGVLPLEAAHALRGCLKDYGDHYTSALAELIEQTQSATPSALSRIPYDALLQPESQFVQCFAAFFLDTLEFHIAATARAVRVAADGAEELTLPAAVNALQNADPHLDADAARAYLTECCRAMVSKASRIPVALLLRRTRELFVQRRTPLEVGAVRKDMRIASTHPVVELEASLNVESSKRSPVKPKSSKPVVSGRLK